MNGRECKKSLQCATNLHTGGPVRIVANAGEHGAWWAREDSNLQPSGYEPPALTIELRARRAGAAQQ